MELWMGRGWSRKFIGLGGKGNSPTHKPSNLPCSVISFHVHRSVTNYLHKLLKQILKTTLRHIQISFTSTRYNRLITFSTLSVECPEEKVWHQRYSDPRRRQKERRRSHHQGRPWCCPEDGTWGCQGLELTWRLNSSRPFSVLFFTFQ